MNARLAGLLFVFVDFVALTLYAVYHYGYTSFFTMHLETAVGAQVLLDLVIALSFFMIWMWRDARENGIAPLPYVLSILFLGSIGALAYLIHRELRTSGVASGAALAS